MKPLRSRFPGAALLALVCALIFGLDPIALRAQAAGSQLVIQPGNPVTVDLVTLQGDLPMTYQWQKNGVPIAGATGTITALPTPAAHVAAFQISASVTKADSGQYSCAIANAFGATISDIATLSVGNPPSGGGTGITKK